jgi:host factor-I protein
MRRSLSSTISFLEQACQQKAAVTIFLVNGVKLMVTSSDGFTVLLVRDGFSQLVYKHAISTILPIQSLKLFGD